MAKDKPQSPVRITNQFRKGQAMVYDLSCEHVRLTIEVTARDAGLEGEAGCALVVDPMGSVSLDSVTVRGNVVGLDKEEGVWRHARGQAGRRQGSRGFDCHGRRVAWHRPEKNATSKANSPM